VGVPTRSNQHICPAKHCSSRSCGRDGIDARLRDLDHLPRGDRRPGTVTQPGGHWAVAGRTAEVTAGCGGKEAQIAQVAEAESDRKPLSVPSRSTTIVATQT